MTINKSAFGKSCQMSKVRKIKVTQNSIKKLPMCEENGVIIHVVDKKYLVPSNMNFTSQRSSVCTRKSKTIVMMSVYLKLRE